MKTLKFHGSVAKRVLEDGGRRSVSSRTSQYHLARLLNQNYPRPPCAHAEKLTLTQIEKISHISNTMEKMILLYGGGGGEFRAPHGVPAQAQKFN